MDDAAEQTYLEAREAAEREAASRSSCMVKDVHIEAADLYAERARRIQERSAEDMPEQEPDQHGDGSQDPR